MTYRAFISSVRNTLDSITTDNFISGEYIASIGLSYARLLTKRESDSKKIFRNTSLFTFVDCIELEEASSKDCGVDLPCKSIMKSKAKLPEIYSSNYGSLINLFNVDRSKEYSELSPLSYKSISGQRFKSKTKGYFWIQNGYIYIPDSEVEVVSAMYLSPESNFDSGSTDTSSCSILDRQFPILDYLEILVIESTIKHLTTSKSIQRDENTNLNVQN